MKLNISFEDFLNTTGELGAVLIIILVIVIVKYFFGSNEQTEKQARIKREENLVTISEKWENVMGISEKLFKKSVTIRLNPYNTLLIVDSKIDLTKVVIYSDRGEKIMEVNADFKSIKIEELPIGIYAIWIYFENGFARN